MTAKDLVGAALILGSVAAAVGVLSLRGDETPPVAGDVQVEPSKVDELLDGAVAYVAEFRTADGGRATRLVPPDCVRRLADAGMTACRQRLGDGGVRDPGPLNRFPADAAVGTRCQPVACSVMAGEDADAEESAIVERRRAKPQEGNNER